MRIDGLDHVVLYSTDIARTVDFYSTVLGMTHAVFDDGYHALHFGDHKVNLHDASAPFAPHARRPVAGALDVCLLTQTPISEVVAHLSAHDVQLIEGPCAQTGARGPMVSVYVHDPDGNLIEIASYEAAPDDSA